MRVFKTTYVVTAIGGFRVQVSSGGDEEGRVSRGEAFMVAILSACGRVDRVDS